MSLVQSIPVNAATRLLQGDVALLRASFEHGLTTDVVWPQWSYPLLHGLAHRNPPEAEEMIRMVLGAGGDPAVEHHSLTPAMMAIAGWNDDSESDEATQERRLVVLKVLSEACDEAALHDLLLGSVSVGWTRAVEHLVSRGADIRRHGERGLTALHEAYRTRHAEIAALLTRGGGDVTATDDEGRTVMDAFLKRDNGSRPVSDADKREFERFSLDIGTRLIEVEAQPVVAAMRL